jgi:hypothetical protein
VLLVIGGVLPDGVDPAEGPPWRLTREEIEAFGADGLALQGIDYDADGVRYLAEFRRAD